MTVNRVDFSTRKPLKMLPVGLMVEVVAVSAPACGGSKAGATPAKALASVGQDPCHRPLRHLGRRLADTGRPDMACSPRLPGRPAAGGQQRI